MSGESEPSSDESRRGMGTLEGPTCAVDVLNFESLDVMDADARVLASFAQ